MASPALERRSLAPLAAPPTPPSAMPPSSCRVQTHWPESLLRACTWPSTVTVRTRSDSRNPASSSCSSGCGSRCGTWATGGGALKRTERIASGSGCWGRSLGRRWAGRGAGARAGRWVASAAGSGAAWAREVTEARSEMRRRTSARARAGGEGMARAARGCGQARAAVSPEWVYCCACRCWCWWSCARRGKAVGGRDRIREQGRPLASSTSLSAGLFGLGSSSVHLRTLIELVSAQPGESRIRSTSSCGGSRASSSTQLSFYRASSPRKAVHFVLSVRRAQADD